MIIKIGLFNIINYYYASTSSYRLVWLNNAHVNNYSVGLTWGKATQIKAGSQYDAGCCVALHQF